MANVFISYSREDKDFVRRLHEALAKINRDTWVDWADIPPTAEWLKEIYSGIESADTFVFIISPGSITSEICAKEVAHAVKQNKRLVPIVCRDVDAKAVPEPLSARNWIFFRESDDFDSAFQSLTKALDTDLEWIRDHTRLLVRALEWDREGRDNSFVLRGKDLKEAEQWLIGGGEKEAKPTPLHTQYIIASRTAETKRQRLTLGGVTLALVVAIALAVVAWIQRNQAVSGELAASAILHLPTDSELSLLLASEAAEVSYTTLAEDALRRSLVESHVRAVMRGHAGAVDSVAFSPDGKVVVTSDDKTAIIWQQIDGKWRSVAKLPDHKDRLNGSVFSPDGKFIVTVSGDGIARIWEVSSDMVIVKQRWHTGEVESAAFSRDSKFIATAGRDNTARVWETSTGKLMTELRGHTGLVESAAFSPDGKFIVTASTDNTARVWETSTGESVLELPHTGYVWEAVFSPDGRFVTTLSRSMGTREGIGAVWDASSGNRIAELLGFSDDVTSMSFSHDGKFFVISGALKAIVWETETWRDVAEFHGHTDYVRSATFSHDGKWIITASRDNTARMWEASTGKIVAELRGHTDRVNGAAFSPDDKLVFTASSDGTVRVWETGKDSSIAELRGHTGAVVSALFSEDTKYVVTASEDKTARIWKNTNGKWQSAAELRGHTGYLRRATFSPDGKLVSTASDDRTVRVWETSTGKVVKVLAGYTDEVNSVAFSPDGKHLAAASKDTTVRIWETGTWRNLELRGHKRSVNSVAFSPNSKWVITASDDGTARVWEVDGTNVTGRSVAELSVGVDSLVRGAAFSPDSNFVITNELLWETKTWRQVAKLGGESMWVSSAVFSSDGKFVVTTGGCNYRNICDSIVRVWEVSAGRNVAELRGNVDRVSSAVFSPDGRWVVTTGDCLFDRCDPVVQVWEAATGRRLVNLRGHTSLIQSATFSPDGKLIVTASLDNTARIYACEPCGSIGDLLVLARSRVTRKLTAEERETRGWYSLPRHHDTPMADDETPPKPPDGHVRPPADGG